MRVQMVRHWIWSSACSLLVAIHVTGCGERLPEEVVVDRRPSRTLPSRFSTSLAARRASSCGPSLATTRKKSRRRSSGNRVRRNATCSGTTKFSARRAVRWSTAVLGGIGACDPGNWRTLAPRARVLIVNTNQVAGLPAPEVARRPDRSAVVRPGRCRQAALRSRGDACRVPVPGRRRREV